MKILVCGDVHWCTYSSILRSRGDKYSTRLDNLIQSVNWVETMANDKQCDKVIYLGDFFDKPTLNSEELSALNDINLYDCKHYFLVGNHEIANNDCSFNSSSLFSFNKNNMVNKLEVIDTPKSIYEKDTDTELFFLPYILERNRKPLSEYIGSGKPLNRLIFSHNDINGLTLGPYISKEGFTVEEINNNCSLFINGHIHNTNEINDNILNLGNLTGQNFSEDAYKYPHRIMYIDTQLHDVEFIENPYALNFYKLEYNSTQTFYNLDDKVKNAVISIKIPFNKEQELKEYLKNCKNIIQYRIITVNNTNTINNEFEINKLDHIGTFIEYIHNNMEKNELIEDELHKIVGI